MKLYTEEQVKQIVEKSRETGLTAEYLMLTTSAIELPSDDEIEEKAEFLFPTVNIMSGPTYIAHKSFIEGAKWMRDKILTK